LSEVSGAVGEDRAFLVSGNGTQKGNERAKKGARKKNTVTIFGKNGGGSRDEKGKRGLQGKSNRT